MRSPPSLPLPRAPARQRRSRFAPMARPAPAARPIHAYSLVACLGSRPHPFLCGIPPEHTDSLGCGSQGDAPLASLTDGVGSVLDREVDFPLAGYAGPGFHNWPGSADVLVGEYETGDSHPATCQKDVRRNVRRRDRGQRPTATKNPDTKPLRRRQSRRCSRVRRPRFPQLARER